MHGDSGEGGKGQGDFQKPSLLLPLSPPLPSPSTGTLSAEGSDLPVSSSVLYCPYTVLYCTALYCTVLYSILLCCDIFYCTVLYCALL